MMEHSSNLHDFVDGTLDSNLENELFSALSSNQSLRTELKQFIEFERTARFDTEAYTPNAASTANIFSRVGIDNYALSPAQAAASATATGGGIIAFLSKYSQGIIGAAIATLFSAGIMFFAMNNSTDTGLPTDNRLTENTNNSQIAIISDSSGFNNNNIPLVSSKENNMPPERIIERVVIKYIEIPKKIIQTNITEQITNTESNNDFAITNESLISSSSIMTNPIELYKGANLLTVMPIRMNNDEVIAYDDKDFGDSDISIEMTGADYFGSKIPRSSEPILENMRIAVIYNLSDNFAIGGELRQEFFYLKYDALGELSKSGQEIDYWQQHTNYQSVGIFGRWKFYNFSNINLFTQFGLSMNGVLDRGIAGPVGRLMIAGEIRPSEDYSFVIGIEGSGLAYQHASVWQTASRFGLLYGLLINF